MSVEYKIFLTKLRDQVAINLMPHLVKIAVTQEVDDYRPEHVASDAWEYAEALIEEREKRYGPPAPEPTE